MDISENQIQMIYSRKDLYEKQLEIIEDIKEKISDNEYLTLLNNLKKIRDRNVIYKIEYYQPELLGRPDSKILDVNIIKNSAYCFNELTGEQIDYLNESLDDSMTLRRVNEMGFKTSTYSCYAFAGYTDNVLVNNKIIHLISFEEI
jgi:hypothetical protein